MLEEGLRLKVWRGAYYFFKHALQEAEKEGVRIADIKSAILEGQLIEDHPTRKRCIFQSYSEDRIPIHVVCDYEGRKVGIVTVYVPNRQRWVRDRIRKGR